MKNRNPADRAAQDGCENMTHSGTSVPIQGRKAVWIFVIITVLLIINGLIGYHYVLPRVQLDVKVIYHEEVAGNIQVNVRLTNSGNKIITNLEVSLDFVDEKGKDLGNRHELFQSIESGIEKNIHLNSSGDPNIDHTINLVLTFSAGENEYSGNWTLEDSKGYMNVAFEKTLKDWFP
ncbi:MAG: hypothetical protein QGH39_02410 [Candidatus Thermoplasmatota archaeon]|jgi:hypothetical protein|nr:hypothetical protein [Candidatus Thermoplasmatota archaeon]MDP7264393.1 hypothetical protein [Candidatus Thermoplasmatota archaeon]